MDVDFGVEVGGCGGRGRYGFRNESGCMCGRERNSEVRGCTVNVQLRKIRPNEK